MGDQSKKWMLAGGAVLAVLGALLLKAPGAWGFAMCWGLAWAALQLWIEARAIDESSKGASEIASHAYKQDGEEPGRGRGSSLFKKGALMAIGSMILAMGSGLSLLGTFAMSGAWGLLALTPLAIIGTMSARTFARQGAEPLDKIRDQGASHG